MRTVAVLCCSGRSIYKYLPGVEAYDSKRDARTFGANMPAVAHPPCRCWSKYLRHFAKPIDAEAEMELGRWCVRTVLQCGGVLEQPAGSHLWKEMNLPMPDRPAQDCFTIYVEQGWFGYASRKPTWVLVSGVPINQVPPLPINQVPPLPFSLAQTRAKSLALSQAGRSRSVTPFAQWLVETARRANPSGLNAISPVRHAIAGAV